MLLEYLISIFCRESQHVHEDAIQTAIAKFTRRYYSLLESITVITENNKNNSGITVYACIISDAHMEDWEAKCVASLNKDITYLITYYNE